jgi:hypothetical protein
MFKGRGLEQHLAPTVVVARAYHAAQERQDEGGGRQGGSIKSNHQCCHRNGQPQDHNANEVDEAEDGEITEQAR